MTTKEDVLEQIVEEYLQHNGYFVQHNVKFCPRADHPDWNRKQDRNYSDIDVLGYNPRLTGAEKVVAVSSKSCQNGFRPSNIIGAISNGTKVDGREVWRAYRELTIPKWSETFCETIASRTGSTVLPTSLQ